MLLQALQIHFNSSSSVHYTLGGTTLVATSSHRDLGVIVSSGFSWTCHHQHIIGKAYQSLGLLRRTFGTSGSVETRRALYLSLVRSKLSYCSPVWRPHLLKDIVKLEQVQRRATHFVLQDASLDCRSRLIKLGILPLMMFFELADIIYQLKNSVCNFSVTDLYQLTKFFWTYFYINFSSDNAGTYHLLCPCSRCSACPQSSNFT